MQSSGTESNPGHGFTFASQPNPHTELLAVGVRLAQPGVAATGITPTYPLILSLSIYKYTCIKYKYMFTKSILLKIFIGKYILLNI